MEEEVVRTAAEVGWVEAVKEEEVRTAAEVGWVEAMAGCTAAGNFGTSPSASAVCMLCGIRC